MMLIKTIKDKIISYDENLRTMDLEEYYTRLRIPLYYVAIIYIVLTVIDINLGEFKLFDFVNALLFSFIVVIYEAFKKVDYFHKVKWVPIAVFILFLIYSQTVVIKNIYRVSHISQILTKLFLPLFFGHMCYHYLRRIHNETKSEKKGHYS